MSCEEDGEFGSEDDADDGEDSECLSAALPTSMRGRVNLGYWEEVTKGQCACFQSTTSSMHF